ncbi:hypothetical protein NXC24_CH03601 [Rhizobium sp. NXC24]|nr:hypothetical protein NXC24_CH03601 [Rhizobium sp. NXC24]
MNLIRDLEIPVLSMPWRGATFGANRHYLRHGKTESQKSPAEDRSLPPFPLKYVFDLGLCHFL